MISVSNSFLYLLFSVVRKAAGKHKKKDTGINAPEASNLDVSLPLENLSIASPPPSTSSSSVVQVIQAGLQDITI